MSDDKDVVEEVEETNADGFESYEDDFDVEELRPMIPTQYTEELLSYGVVEVSKLGIAKFLSIIMMFRFNSDNFLSPWPRAISLKISVIALN